MTTVLPTQNLVAWKVSNIIQEKQENYFMIFDPKFTTWSRTLGLQKKKGTHRDKRHEGFWARPHWQRGEWGRSEQGTMARPRFRRRSRQGSQLSQLEATASAAVEKKQKKREEETTSSAAA